MKLPKTAPPSLLATPRWICWRALKDPKDDRVKKIPVSPRTGEAIGATAKYQDQFVTFDQALDYAQKNKLGVSFVMLADDGVVGIDIDKGIDPDGTIRPKVAEWLRFFSHTYAETSPSGTGIHILCRGKINQALTAVQIPGDDTAKVEVYAWDRHLTFTGAKLSASTDDLADAQLSLEKLIGTVAAQPKDKPQAFTIERIRHFYQKNLDALRNAAAGTRNNQLNACVYFAARAFASGALEEDETRVKQDLNEAAQTAWGGEVPSSDAATIRGAWLTGLKNPFEIAPSPHGDLDKLLVEFNDKFFVVGNFGGKCIIAAYDPHPELRGKYRLSTQNPYDFKNRWDNVKVQTGVNSSGDPTFEGRGTAWFDHELRRYYDEIIFTPGQQPPQGSYNLWRGFAVEPKPGDVSLYLDYLSSVICPGSEQNLNALLDLLSYWIRHPNEQGHSAIVLRGSEGAGKNFFADSFGFLWGSHYHMLVHSDNVAGRFNSQLHHCSVVCCNEAFFAGNHQQTNVLKSLITDPTLQIEYKFRDSISCPNRLHLIICSNEDWVISAGIDARRFFMLNVSNAHKEDFSYFGRLQQWLENGGYEALLDFLLKRGLNGFQPRSMPKTAALNQQKVHSLTKAEYVWYECLYTGSVPGAYDRRKRLCLRKEDLMQWAIENLDRRRLSSLSTNGLAMFLESIGCPGERTMWDVYPGDTSSRFGPSKKVRVNLVPDLTTARHQWDERMFPGDWDDLTEWELIHNLDGKRLQSEKPEGKGDLL